MKIEIYAEMHLVFDNDYDVYKITQELGIKPTECKNRCELSINPLTGKLLEGFWTIRSKISYELDINLVLNNLISLFSNKLFEIKNICDANGGEVVFDIVPSFGLDNSPALYFDRDFLDIVNFLNATIQIDMYIS